MSTVKNQNVTKTSKQASFCQPIETLETRQMLSASATEFVPQSLNTRLELGVQTASVNAQAHHHGGHAAGHGKQGGVGTLISVLPIRYIPRIPLPWFFIEPKTNSAVTQWHDFSKNPLFNTGGPSMNDIRQGEAADCYFLATLAETALRDPNTIRNAISQRADGTYDVKFHTSTTTTIDYHVDGQLPEDAYGDLVYAQLGQGGCTWVPIMEKAFTYFRNRNIAANYATIDYGWGSEAMKDLGASPTEVLPSVSNSTTLFNDVVWGLIFGTGMNLGTNNASGPLVNGHEYSVVSARVKNGVNQIEVRNPWGDNPNWNNNSNYDATNDGYMWVNASAVYPELSEFVSATL